MVENNYNISEKYKRIYQGILKWKANNYNGLFQYTERIDIPLVVNEVIQHVSLQSENPYICIVVPNISIKSSIKKVDFNSNITVDTFDDFKSKISKNCKKDELFYCNTFIVLDCVNDVYIKSKAYSKIFKKVSANRNLYITTKKISIDILSELSKNNINVIDIITKAQAIENGYISPNVIYNVGIEFTQKEKEIYTQLTEQISSMLSVFKGKAKMMNIEFKRVTKCKIDMVENDMKLIEACHKGINYVNDLNDKVTHLHSEMVRNMLADIMGWKADLDLSNDYNKQVDMYWNPNNILTRTKAFSDAIDKRIELYNDNINKREVIKYITSNIKGKGIILNKSKSLIDFIEGLDKCMSWYKNIPSRICYDFDGKPYEYSSGTKKGQPKVFGSIGIKKECVKHLEHGDVSIIGTDTIANKDFDIEGLNVLVCTSPYCNPFNTISDLKLQQPYINKVSLIIWLYMQDFAVNSQDYKVSKEKEKLIESQSKFHIDTIWTNSIKDVKF